MSTPQRLRFVRTQVVVLLGLLLALSVVGLFSPDLFVLLGIIGFITVTELLLPAEIRPRWYDRLGTLTTLALLAAVLVVSFRVVQLYTPGAIP